MSDLLITLLPYILYIAIIATLAYFAYRRTSSHADYMLGGRSLGGAVGALTVGASDMSSWLLLALPGAFYINGINQLWLPLGLAIGQFLNWTLIAPRLRVFTEQFKDSLTIPSYFHNRFKDQKGWLRIATAVVILIFYAVYTASGFVAMAVALEAAFKQYGIDYTDGLIMGGLIVVLYSVIGGFLAVAWIDFFQGCLMFVAILLVPFAAISSMGGYSETMALAEQYNPDSLNIFAGMTAMGVISLMAWGLGYCGQPHVIIRFMALKSVREVPKARFICMSWMILAMYGAMLTGLAALAYFQSHGAPLERASTSLLALSNALLHPFVTGGIVAAVLSASMSTISSQLLVAASSLAEDVYHGLLRPNATSKELLWVGRLVLIAVAGVALIIAFDPKSSILALVANAWAGLGAAFGSVIIGSLFWRNMTRNGALAGMISGAATVIIWTNLSNLGGIFALYSIVPGFIVSGLCIVIFSKFGNGNSLDELHLEYDAALNACHKK
ncbi:sodium/proline symporter [Sinobacterium caligoides]|uniref:Sodium/proline symporter n=1 Tax=Sinobacterium caligoides TaxID=933926 RepID=A0A3N2E0N1_9GAMM|nr:sodium/proline symporter [Sinobacterium caligoides]